MEGLSRQATSLLEFTTLRRRGMKVIVRDKNIQPYFLDSGSRPWSLYVEGVKIAQFSYVESEDMLTVESPDYGVYVRQEPTQEKEGESMAAVKKETGISEEEFILRAMKIGRRPNRQALPLGASGLEIAFESYFHKKIRPVLDELQKREMIYIVEGKRDVLIYEGTAKVPRAREVKAQVLLRKLLEE